MHIKILATAALATITALGTAAAADLPAYKAPPPATASNWTGCYVGGGGGYGMWNEGSFVSSGGVAVTAPQTNGGKGWFGQGQAGCDYQLTAPIFNMNVVIGAFGDYSADSLLGTSAFPGAVGSEREASAWAAGGRVGALITPHVLAYSDVGWTQARFDAVNYGIAVPGGPYSGLSLPAATYNGWFIGSGFEYALDWLPLRGVFLKTEYRYSQYNSASVPLTGFLVGTGSFAFSSQKTTQMVSTELVWHFNWLGGHY
ncbi:MAG: outer membrane protein [Xanthobacteraceae bacterium]